MLSITVLSLFVDEVEPWLRLILTLLISLSVHDKVLPLEEETELFSSNLPSQSESVGVMIGEEGRTSVKCVVCIGGWDCSVEARETVGVVVVSRLLELMAGTGFSDSAGISCFVCGI